MQLILLALVATIAGLGTSAFLGPCVTIGWQLLVACSLFISLWKKQSKFFLLFLFVFFFSLAHLRYQALMLPHDDVVKIGQLTRKMTVTGKVVDIKQLTHGRSQLDLQLEAVVNKSRPVQLNEALRMRLYLEQGTDQLYPGDALRFKSRLRKPRLFGMPGEFDWPRYLAGQGIHLTGWAKSADQIERLASHQQYPGRIIAAWRQTIAAAMVERMPDLRADLTRALVLGEGRILPTEVRRTLAAGGISHLFAISGLHLGLIGLLSYRLLFYFYCRCPRLLEWQPPQKILPLFIVPALLLYLIFTGDAVATRRAFALFTLGAVFLVWRYYVNPLMMLVSLAFMSLLINPLLLWQAGWQLSFSGAAGILLWRPVWQSRTISTLPGFLRYAMQLFLVTLSAMLTTFPLVVMHFHLAAPAGVLTNLICVPVVTLIALPVGMVGLLLFFFFPSLSMFLFHLSGMTLELLFRISERLIAIPAFGGQPLFLNIWQHLAITCCVSAVIVVVRLHAKRNGIVIMLVSFCLAIGFWYMPVSTTESVSLTMFSVGQGESLLLQNRAGQTVLIDGGGLYSPRFDVGERLLAPAFGALDVHELDAVVLTHDHPDHRKGLIYILANFSVKAFYTGHDFSELHPSLQQILTRKDIPCLTVQNGWERMTFWEYGNLLVYNGTRPGFSENDSSLAMYLRVGKDDGLLLTGDLEQQGVRSLLDSKIPGPVTLLKLPHHGSRYSFTDHLVEMISPEACLVSVGYQNRYHLPAKQVVNDLKDRGIPLYRTDTSGTVMAQFSDHGWEVRHWQRGLFR